MADPKTKIYHRDLDRTVEVPASTVHIWERSGWTSDRMAELVKVSQDLGLYDDLDPLSTAPGETLAADQGDDNPVPEGDDNTDPPKEG